MLFYVGSFFLLFVVIQLVRSTSVLSDLIPLPSNASMFAHFQLQSDTLQKNIDTTIFVHIHVPKAGGTALAFALSSNCSCVLKPVRDEFKPYCYNCPMVSTQITFPGNAAARHSGDYEYEDLHHPRHLKYSVDSNNTKNDDESLYTTHASDHNWVYSINRATGWRFGVHVPYSIMKQSMNQIHNFGYYPLAIMMIRDPFDRYVSEILKWTDHQGKALDWSVDFKALQVQYGSFFQQNLVDDFNTRLLFMFANLSNAEHILPNRQIKMIGGQAKHFNMDFNADRNYGSRWHSANAQKGVLDPILVRAWKIITEECGVLIGIHEQFEEFLCVLEVLFGGKYQFLWNNQVHTHEPIPKAPQHNRRKGNNGTKVKANIIESSHYEEYNQDSLLRELWQANNQHDIIFYQQVKEYSQSQLQFYLQQLRMRFGISSDMTKFTNPELWKQVKYQHPHCVTFL